jgi:hypothetical protein
VTVCVAAVFDNFGIVGASDRMLTAGDVQFEPSVPKLRFWTNSIAGMVAGDANIQTEIGEEVNRVVNERIDANPNEWLKVKDVASIYKQECDKILGAMAERRILTPFGITRSEFLTRQKDFSADFVKDIAQELLNFEAPSVETIIAGVDRAGPHIYTVDANSMQSHLTVGFAAIGAGRDHANSQMMAFNHTFRHSLADTLRAVLFSKKRAEIAPGVGPDTDMFVVTGLGGLSLLRDDVQDELEKRYAEERRRQAKVADITRTKISQFVQGILDKPASTEQAQLPAPPSSDPPLVVETPQT